MLWPIRRRLLAAAQVVCALALIPGFVVVVWSIANGPEVLHAFGIDTWLPGGELHDTSFAIAVPVLFLSITRLSRFMDRVRLDAIAGIGDPLPPAKPLIDLSSGVYPTPIVYTWSRSLASRVGLFCGFAFLVACASGLAELVYWTSGFAPMTVIEVSVVWLFVCFLLFMAFTLLRFVVQGARGVVVDEYGVSSWSQSGPRNTVPWADARLLETWRTGIGVTLYRLYAFDGRYLTWRLPGLHAAASHAKEGATTDTLRRVQAILELAQSRARLIPRTFLAELMDSALNKPTNDVIPMTRKTVEAMLTGMSSIPIAFTIGYGLSVLATPSPLAPWAPRIAAGTLLVAGLWSFVNVLRRALSLPTVLTPAQRPQWQSLAAGLGDRTVSTYSRQSRLERAGSGIHSALLVIGSVAGLATLVSSLLAGHPLTDGWTQVGGMVWLFLAMLFGVLRLSGLRRPRSMQLTASVAGLQTSTTPTIPWDEITSLRYVSNGKQRFVYFLGSKRHFDIHWMNDAAPDMVSGISFDPASDGINLIDADTFAAVVAARTGLTPIQIVAW